MSKPEKATDSTKSKYRKQVNITFFDPKKYKRFRTLLDTIHEKQVNSDESQRLTLASVVTKALEILESNLSSETTNKHSSQLPKEAENRKVSGRLAFPSASALDNSCVFRVEISEEKYIVCMKDFNAKGKIHKLHKEACQNCYEKSLVMPTAPSFRKKKDREKLPYKFIPRKSERTEKPAKPSFTIPDTYCPEKEQIVKVTVCEMHKARDPLEWEACQELKAKNRSLKNQKGDERKR